MSKQIKQKRDEELYKIQGLINAMGELERRFFSLNLGEIGNKRVKKYFRERYSNFYDWLNEQ